MAFGAMEAFKEAKKKLPLIVGINASKEAVEFIKSGEMLASGDYNGLIEACLGRDRHSHAPQAAGPEGGAAKTAVVDKSNYQAYEVPPNGDLARPWRAWRRSDPPRASLGWTSVGRHDLSASALPCARSRPVAAKFWAKQIRNI